MTSYTEEDLRAALAHEADAGPAVVDVWPRLHRRIVVRRRVRAGVAAVAVAAAASIVVVALPPDSNTARLPIASGATTLLPNHPLSDAALATSADILRQRIDRLGIDGAEITTHDGTLSVSAHGLSSAEITALAATGDFQLRPVEQVGSGNGCPSPPSDRFACTADGTPYTVGAVALDHGDVQHAQAVHMGGPPPASTWVVDVTFNQLGAQKFYSLTKNVATRPSVDSGCQPPQGCNAIAIIVDGTVLSAPAVQAQGGIRGGQLQIPGLTRLQARTLAAIVANPPLPAGFSIDVRSGA